MKRPAYCVKCFFKVYRYNLEHSINCCTSFSFSDDGFYVYINAKNGRENETARFFSPNLHASDNSCFTFWYIMYASYTYKSDMGTLRVYKDSIQTDRIVWEVSGNQRYGWIKAAIDIHQGDFKIIFEGIRGSSKRSDIAIDDISLTKGTCSGN